MGVGGEIVGSKMPNDAEGEQEQEEEDGFPVVGFA